jgi:hypothetical protein
MPLPSQPDLTAPVLVAGHLGDRPPRLRIVRATIGGPGTRAKRSTMASIAKLVPVMPDHPLVDPFAEKLTVMP